MQHKVFFAEPDLCVFSYLSFKVLLQDVLVVEDITALKKPVDKDGLT